MHDVFNARFNGFFGVAPGFGRSMAHPLRTVFTHIAPFAEHFIEVASALLNFSL
jgi:hypothetical protein